MADVESRSWDPPAWASGALAAEFGPPPRIGVFQAARRYWALVLLPILVLGPVVGVVAAKRVPTYSAEARLIVGQLNISTPGAIAGYTQAAQDLAATYPLLIYTDGVVNRVARELHVSPGEVRASISATAVPGSSVIRVDATSQSELEAPMLANAASDSLVAYLGSVSRHDPTLGVLSAQLERAELAYQKAQAAQAKAASANQTLTTQANQALTTQANQPLTAQDQRLAARVATAKVKVDSIVQNYQTAVQNEGISSNLQTVTRASGASSDRASKFQIAITAALLAGVILGLALATLYANVALRRKLTLPAWTPSPPSDGPGSSRDIDPLERA